jgi:hypothetical protein
MSHVSMTYYTIELVLPFPLFVVNSPISIPESVQSGVRFVPNPRQVVEKYASIVMKSDVAENKAHVSR